MKSFTIATLGSHSALDLCRGAKDEGFRTLVICERGREKTYAKHYRSRDNIGCVDECLIVDRYAEILKPDFQKELLKRNCVFVPHRSFEVYLNFDYHAIEKRFIVPIFGNKYLLRMEERGTKPNQYDFLDAAGIRYPRQFKDPTVIDRVCLVKVLEKERGFERAFFLVSDYGEYRKIARDNITKGIFTREQLDRSVIEEFVIGAQVNFNYFYSPLEKRLELLGTDTRRQTNLDGLLRLSARYQDRALEKVRIQYEEAGHIAVTVLESLLEKAYELGERFVRASQRLRPSGIIGPFALQSIIIPGPPKKDIIVIDVSPRIPGSPGIHATPYSRYLHGRMLSVGDRIAMEMSHAIDMNKLELLIT